VSIFEVLGFRKQASHSDAAETETVRKIAHQLDELDPTRARHVAVFAYVLSRVARADLKVSEEETREIERLVAEKSGLPAAQAVMVVQIAKHQNLLFGATEDYLVTREFNNVATHEEKLALLDCAFAVAAAGSSVTTVEDNEIRKIADQLRIEHPEYIAVRARYRDRLGVFDKS
jgi:uncharacterized tellurite resistance protein B-like protein